MANEIISYLEMCRREGISLQRGMNFNIGGKHYSVILMSQRDNAPYSDKIEDNGTTLIYEGHDVPKTKDNPYPKLVDQEKHTPNGKLTENGKFYKAAQDYKKNKLSPHIARVYEKIKTGIWSYNGTFELIDSWFERVSNRNVFKFKLVAIQDDIKTAEYKEPSIIHTRLIPTWVKREVFKRDKGKCVKCGTSKNLHFDHIIPFSKGGASDTPENIQLLCSKHNLEKRDRIE